MEFMHRTAHTFSFLPEFSENGVSDIQRRSEKYYTWFNMAQIDGEV